MDHFKKEIERDFDDGGKWIKLHEVVQHYQNGMIHISANPIGHNAIVPRSKSSSAICGYCDGTYADPLDVHTIKITPGQARELIGALTELLDKNGNSQ